MRLNLDVIQDHLSGEYQVRQYGLTDRSHTFARPLLYESGMPMKENTLYIAQAEFLPRFLPSQTTGVICVGHRIPREWLAGGAHLLIVQDAHSVLSVFNAIHELFNHLEAWDEQLRDELEQDESFDLRQILALGTQELGHSISVFDQALRLILYAELRNGLGDTQSASVLDELGAMSVEHGEMIREICRLERVITVPYLSSVIHEGGRYYCFNLYPAGSFSGCVVITEGTQPFRNGDFLLMDHFFSYFQKAFWKYLHSYIQKENASLDVVQRLLTHMPVDGDANEYLPLAPGESWVCFQLREDHSSRSLIKEYMAAILNGLLSRTTYTVLHQGAIVGVLRLPARESQEMNPFSVLEEALRRMGYVGGVSTPFTDLYALEDYQRQANYAVASGWDAGGPLCFFQDHALSYMLDVCTREMPTEALCPQGLMVLRKHDKERGTEYVRTLDTYLQNEMHTTQTAEALYIHRSSLIKRLDKIQRLIGDDLNNPEVRLYYRIALHLLNKER